MEALEAGLRADMEALEAGLRADMEALEAGLRADMKALETGLRAEMTVFRVDLEGKIKDLRVEMFTLGAGLQETVNRQYQDLRDRIERQGREIARQRARMAWITIGAAGFLASLITLFEFIS